MLLNDISPETWEQWKKKRRNTLIGYLLIGGMIGMDFSFVFTTLYVYLEQIIKTDHPKLFYGLIIGANSISSALFGVICGRWADKTRKIKLYANVSLILQIIGCILYVLHFNVVYPLIGRFISGFGDPFISVSSGELLRIYDTEESTRALWWLASANSFGFMIGPVVVLFFKNVDFYIWSIHITQLNVIGLCMAALLLLTLVVANFLIHDCSAQIDLKEYMQKEREQERQKGREDCSEKYPNGKYPSLASSDDTTTYPVFPITTILRKLLQSVDAVLMFISTSIFMYCFFATDVLIPLLTIIILDWSLTALTWVLFGYGVLYLVLLILMSKYCAGERTVYIISLVCMSAGILMFFIMVGMKVFPRDLSRDTVLMSLLVVLYSFAWIIEEVVIKCMLAKMVPSHCQSFTECSRNAVSRSSTIIASVTAPLVVPFLHWWSMGLIVVMSLVLIVFVVRRKHLCEIKEIDFQENEVDKRFSVQSCCMGPPREYLISRIQPEK